jgi:hypothetical protein
MLAIALYHILFGPPTLKSLKISNAQQAVAAALSSLPSGRAVQGTEVIELIKGADPADPASARWHVQFLLAPVKSFSLNPLPTPNALASRNLVAPDLAIVDVIVDPVSARAIPIGR